MTALRTGSFPLPPAVAAHEHAWVTESRHVISTGTVLYVRCASCGIRRVDLQEHTTAPPSAMSRPVGGLDHVQPSRVSRAVP